MTQTAYSAGLGSNVTSGVYAPQTGTIILQGAGNYTASATKVKFDPLALPGGRPMPTLRPACWKPKA